MGDSLQRTWEESNREFQGGCVEFSLNSIPLKMRALKARAERDSVKGTDVARSSQTRTLLCPLPDS
jgi:hypothetical protein